MAVPIVELEGTWQEITAHAPDFAGRKLRVIVFPADDVGRTRGDAQVDASDALGRLIDVSQVDTGIRDLAREHDHYVHGKPKKKT